MILIFGGAYQGKLDYALNSFCLSENDVHRCSDTITAIPQQKRIIYELDKWLLAMVKDGLDTDDALQQFINANTDAIVICNDISCGIVPVDPTLRKWREAVGISLMKLSHISNEVVRIFCSIPIKIK